MGLKLLVAYKDSVSYGPRLKFVTRAHRLTDKEIGPAIARRLRLAVQTAR
ncbi:putative oxidoreductase, partial [Roseobacter sp. N2S]|nr:putative oxidoreductase [Roseobacter sp. N2S]